MIGCGRGIDMKKIVVVGSLNMDLVTQTERIPVVGETLTGVAFTTVCGGKGANQAFATARLGGDVAMLGCVGDDAFGRELKRNLESQGVDCANIKICEGVASGTASITVCQGDNSIVIIPGANGEVSVQYIEENLECLKQAAVIILQLEIPTETVEFIVDFATKEGIPIMLNPAPAKELSQELLKKVTYLIVNETECEFYTGETVASIKDAKEGIEQLRNKGVAHAIVTMGSQGAVFDFKEEICHQPAKKVNAVDSTAAGDTFVGALAVSLIEGKNIKEAVHFATEASAITVTRVGAQNSIPSREEVRKFCNV